MNWPMGGVLICMCGSFQITPEAEDGAFHQLLEYLETSRSSKGRVTI